MKPPLFLCSGGGYRWIADRVSDQAALPFFARRYNVFILSYSVGEYTKNLRPLRELSETVCALREHSEWQVDTEHIAVCGFSAGGHLAASLGTMWDSPELEKVCGRQNGKNRQNCMILGYPVILADEFAHVESIENVSGCKEGEPGCRLFSLDRHVSLNTCQTFLWHTAGRDVHLLSCLLWQIASLMF